MVRVARVMKVVRVIRVIRVIKICLSRGSEGSFLRFNYGLEGFVTSTWPRAAAGRSSPAATPNDARALGRIC